MRQTADAPVRVLPLQSDLQVVPAGAHDEARQARVHAADCQHQAAHEPLRRSMDRDLGPGVRDRRDGGPCIETNR